MKVCKGGCAHLGNIERDCPSQCPNMIDVDIEQIPQTPEADVRLNNLLNAYAETLRGFVADRKKAHDSMDWPHKFLVAHEGIGIMTALELLEAFRKDHGI